jgi:hypothetical protein
MDRCSKCGADTELYESGVPLCVRCAAAIDDARKETAIEQVAHYRPESQTMREPVQVAMRRALARASHPGR